MQGLIDHHIVDSVKSDETLSFTPLYHRYKHRVYAYCYRLLRHPQNAEDATQETFVKIHRSLNQLQHASSLQTWIFSIARNEAFTLLRRSRPTEDLKMAGEELWDEDGPLELIVQKERAEAVQACLGRLRPYYRELLVLREYEQFSYEEIARIVGSTESAVKSGLFKARKAIGKRLEMILKEGKSNDV